MGFNSGFKGLNYILCCDYPGVESDRKLAIITGHCLFFLIRPLTKRNDGTAVLRLCNLECRP